MSVWHACDICRNDNDNEEEEDDDAVSSVNVEDYMSTWFKLIEFSMQIFIKKTVF
jgi:hypothetical protein